MNAPLFATAPVAELAGFIIIVPFAALASWTIIALRRWLWLGDFEPRWRTRYLIHCCVGLALGIFFAFFMKYPVANAKLEGFPIPVAISNREKPGAEYQSSQMPATIRIGGMVTDVLSGIALCLAPIAIGAFLKENRGKLGAPQPPAANPPA